ncbi:hypothetical protein NPIL_575011 [Nephila pilipes]|uniref:Uncharacterized protein n=1 Tax=Nephila pilipes TaxID=299642 RepID=A0A8X6QHB7_NEPPI|nr:hypothetical protein NPIL_575011 [Nephila pilipes]
MVDLRRFIYLQNIELYKIKKSFNLSSNSVNLENEGVSVDMWDSKKGPPHQEAVDMLNAQEIHFSTANKDVPPNKNIIPQRFSNAKKKKKLTKTSTVTSQNKDNNTILKIILYNKNFIHSPLEES